jgi:hypothetical protein
VDIVALILPSPATVALAFYYFQQLRQASRLSQAQADEPLSRVPQGREVDSCNRTYNKAVGGKEVVLAISEWAISGNSLMNQQFLIWDPEMFRDSNREFYRSQTYTGDYKWARLAQCGLKGFNGLAHERYDKAETSIYDQPPRAQPCSLDTVESDSFHRVVQKEGSTASESSDDQDSDGTSIAGSVVELPKGVGQAWRGARQCTAWCPGRYS